jgi:putative tryptophan/tyrosine transport system substrate-binding protein
MRYKVSAFLLAAFLTAPYLAEAEQKVKAVPKIGFIVSSGRPSSRHLESFRAGLHDLGYVEGKNILLELRYAEGRLDRMAPFVHEFVEQKVDVIMGVNNVATRAAMRATKTIPIVMISSIDPVAAGYVESFGHPGGNVTGLGSLSRELSGKRLELLRELLPKMSRVGVLWDPDGPGPAIALKEYEEAARAFKLELHSFEIRGPNPDLSAAFRAAKKVPVDALIVVVNPLMGQLAAKVFKLAAKYRLPSMTEARRFVDAGALMSYGANTGDLYRRSAAFVDKILKGSKPADLPVEHPNRFELVINHETAKQIGVTIPPSLLIRSDK